MFILICVSTPITRWQSFIGYFLAIFVTVWAAKIPLLLVLKRALIEIPFVFFAILAFLI